MSQLAKQKPGTWILVVCGPAGTHPGKEARFWASRREYVSLHCH